MTAVSVVALAVATPGAVPAPELKFTDTKLKNGLRVIIHEDHTAPVFSIAVIYNAGSRDRAAGPYRVRASVRARAVLMAQDALYFNEPGRINKLPDRIAAVTAADVQRVATTYLVPGRRTVVIANPKPAAAKGGLQ